MQTSLLKSWSFFNFLLFPLQDNISKSVKVPKDTGEKREPSLDSVKKEFLDCSADMLHNLLGVESSTIEKMLDSADSAAKYLGVAEGCS